MTFKFACATAAVLALSGAALGGSYMEASYNWDNGGTILGSYGNLGSATVVADPMGGSDNVLALTEDPIGGTPQAYVCWITGLTDGHQIDVSFMGLGSNDNGYSSSRIWAHYATSDDITAYEGSASGNSTYSGSEWTELGHSWTFDSNDGERDALVIEARIYTTSGDSGTTYIKNLFASVFGEDLEGVEINFPAPVPAPAALALLGVAGIATRRRRR
ncbi:MAG: hypothetical protein MK074_05315 [Phycisphaerales bacterium]|nr:hypothetical protein [Phycisphaerales bacterium]